MPGAYELISILAIILAVWLVLKLAKMAIKLTLFLIVVVLLAGIVYFLFMR